VGAAPPRVHAAVVDAAAPAQAAAAQTTTTPAIARSAVAHTATIAGFAFHPASVTVTAGDTIAWTNEDPASHTVTADDGSFDTGTLAKGTSGSHTFATAGTFAYHCTIHPTMTGTVTVVAAPSTGAGGGAATPSPAGFVPSAPGTLPRTGWDPVGVAVVGAALLLAGLALRARTRPR
jgi:plastocyanin